MLTLTRMTKTEPAYVPPSWSSGTDQEIVNALQKHYDPNDPLDLHEYWNVGEERRISLSSIQGLDDTEGTYPAQDVIFVLSNVGGKYLADGVTECCFQVDQKAMLNNNYHYGRLNSTETNVGGYALCDRHDWCNTNYYNAIPITIRPIFKQVLNESGDGNGSAAITRTFDFFALRSEIEIGSTSIRHYSSAYISEGSQVEWFETSSNKQRGQIWTRSACSADGESNKYYVAFLDGESYVTLPTNRRGIAPFGAI